MADDTLLSELRSLALRRLAPMLAEVLEKSDDALFDIWQQSSANDQAELFEAMRELRRQRSAVEAGVRSRLEEDFTALRKRAAQAGKDQDDAGSGEELSLSLVDPEGLEEQLTCERLAVAIERRHVDGLQRLTRGFGAALGVADLDPNLMPIAPLKVAEAWREALKPALARIEWRLVAHKLLERILTNGYGKLIEDLLQLLHARGIVVQLPAQQRRVMAPVRVGRGPGDPAAAAAGPGAAGAAPGGTGAAPAGYGGYGGGPGPGVAGDGYGGYVEASEGPDPLYLAMREMFAAYLGGARQAANPNEPPDPTPRLKSEVALVVLSRLQRQPTPTLLKLADDRQIEFAGVLKDELLRTAQTLGKVEQGARLEAHDEQAITMVGMLFDTLLDQGHFTREVRERFVRLFLPYVKVAVLDRRLFAHKTHPARRLLNLLAEACEGNAGDAPAERELLAKVMATSERLIDEFGEDPDLFNVLEADFGAFVEKHRKRTSLAEQRAAEAQRGRERLEEARQEAALELDSLVGKRQMPKPIGDFLRRDWTHHLTMVALKDGVDSEAFRAARTPGVKLWMALLACEGGVAPPSGLAESLLPAMRSAGQSDDTAQTALDDIVAALQATAVRARPPEAARAAPTAAVPTAPSSPAAAEPAAPAAPLPAPESLPVFELVTAEPEPEPATPASAKAEGDLEIQVDTSHALPDLIERVRKLEVGSWVEFVQPDGSTQPAKLSWISPISSRMLFVNRRGLRMCTVSAEELAALIAENKLTLRAVDAAFDRAMTQVLDRLKQRTQPKAPAPARN